MGGMLGVGFRIDIRYVVIGSISNLERLFFFLVEGLGFFE